MNKDLGDVGPDNILPLIGWITLTTYLPLTSLSLSLLYVLCESTDHLFTKRPFCFQKQKKEQINYLVH